MRRMSRLVALAVAVACLSGCAALPGLAAALGVAAPVVSAIDAQLQRAQQLAPGLSPQRSDDAVLLAEIVRMLDAYDSCEAAKNAALAPTAPSDTARTTQALLDGAAALRGLVDAVRAAQPAPLPSSVLPFATATPSPTTDARAP